MPCVCARALVCVCVCVDIVFGLRPQSEKPLVRMLILCERKHRARPVAANLARCCASLAFKRPENVVRVAVSVC